MKNVHKVQLSILNKTLCNASQSRFYKEKLKNISTYDEFRTLPITDYKSYEHEINQQRETSENILCKNIVRFQPTSGSTSPIKWIPYNKELLGDFDKAASVWMADMATTFPKIKKGRHYWSLSWLPNHLRSTQSLDDSEVLSPIKRYLMQKFFAVPKEVMFTEKIEDNLFGTVCFLVAASDLSLISVWSPTFLLSILETIKTNHSEIIQTLKTGKWSTKRNMPLKAPKNIEQATLLQKLYSIDEYFHLWPKLGLISCWDTAQSDRYAKKVKELFPNTPVQGKGLWATEAVVTIPVLDKYCLSFQSHFYEFENIETKEILPSWKLKSGMQVSPIVTTPNGFLRYRMNDRLIVTELLGQCPTLTFIGRINDCDLVGEKLSQENVSKLFETIQDSCTPFCLIGIELPNKTKLPYYILLVESIKKSESEISDDCENFLQQNYHYELARNLNQLDKVKVYQSNDTLKIYERLAISKGMIKGNIKLEPLLITKCDNFIKDLHE